MISKFIFVWCLLHLEAHVGYSLEYSQKSSDNIQCNLDVSHKIYNVTDLLRCMSQLAMNLLVQNNDRLSKQMRSDKETSYEFPFENIILNLFNNEVPLIYQDFPLDPTASNYQLNYPSIPNVSFNQFGGLGINLFNALSSISRYDDLKCVSRILCEVASGKPPGRYKQASTESDRQYHLGEFGRNFFSQWLVGLAEAYPILSFARAAMLGYSSNGNPTMCYHAFPRCPHNSDKLVHYLNNHKGGFFRFFSSGEPNSLPQLSYLSKDKTLDSFGGGLGRQALPLGITRAEIDHSTTVKLIPTFIVQNLFRSSFLKDNMLESLERVMYSRQESFGDKNDRSVENRSFEFLLNLQRPDANLFLRDPIPFFPKESEEQSVRVLRFTPELLDSVARSGFRFPR